MLCGLDLMVCSLRKLQGEDVGFLVAMYQNPEIMRHICPVLSTEEVERIHKTMLTQIEKKRAVYYVIEDKITDANIGLIGMQLKSKENHVESGAMILPVYQQQGIFKCAHQSLMRESIKHFTTKICVAFIHKDNKAALKSYQNIGFVRVENKSVNKHQIKLVINMHITE